METPRQKYIRHLGDLQTERSTWLPQWQDLSDFISPRRYRYFQTDRNKGVRKDQNIINSRPRKALGVLQAGMMSGITPESRPWFRFTTSDSGLSKSANVRAWLDVCEEIVRETLSKSNFYTSLFQVYGDLGLFGTSPMHVDEDFEDVIRCYVWPAGQYCLSNSARLQVTSSYREFQLTVEQMVEKFGLQPCSQRVQELHRQGKYSEPIPVVHVVEPNQDHEPGRPGWRFMKFKSVWLEAASDASMNEAGFLAEGGYNENPVMAPRWDVTGEDVYGESPAMVALGDVKALQALERLKALTFEKIVNPPMKGPMSLQNRKASILPGRVTYVPETSAGQTFAPAMTVNPEAMTVSEATIHEHLQRIDSDFYADLWLMMANSEDPRMTATEVAERKAEKMLQLGPVMDRVTGELLSPAIGRVFGILQRKGLVPKPPQEIQGRTVRIQYISIVAQAQKMMAIGAIDKLAAFANGVAQGRPDILDKLDVDAMVDEYGDDLGVPSKLIVPTDRAKKIRAQRAQQQAQAQQMEQLQAATKSAQQLSGASLDGDNALSRIVNALPESAQGGGLEQ